MKQFTLPNTNQMIACHHCDLLLQRPALTGKASASCPRCGSTVAKAAPNRRQHCLALSLGGLMMLWPALYLPMLTMDILGLSNSSNLLASILVTWQAGYLLVSISTALFCLLVPMLLLMLLLLLQLDSLPNRWRLRLMRLLHHLREWSMLDIYLLGLLVSIVKLSDMTGLTLGPGIFCFVMLMVCLLVGLKEFDPESHWRRLEPQP